MQEKKENMKRWIYYANWYYYL